MTFANIPDGMSVFLDANVFVYHFTLHPVFGPPSTDLLERVELKQVAGLTSAHILSEAAHRIMSLEACQLYGWPFPGIAQRLRKHPQEVQKLTQFRQAVEEISHMGVVVAPVSGPLVVEAAIVSQQTGLLSNDALILAVMQDQGLSNLASQDADFDRVPTLTRYAPV